MIIDKLTDENITQYNSSDLFNEYTGSGSFVGIFPVYAVDDSITASSGGTFRVAQKRDSNSDGTIDVAYLQLIDGDILSTDTLTNNTRPYWTL